VDVREKLTSEREIAEDLRSGPAMIAQNLEEEGCFTGVELLTTPKAWAIITEPVVYRISGVCLNERKVGWMGRVVISWPGRVRDELQCAFRRLVPAANGL